MKSAAFPIGGCALAALVLALALVLAFPFDVALAQAAKGGAADTGVPNALQGFSQNKDKPVQIEAQQLDVRDKDKIAVFSGNVVVTQGDTIMKCKTLHVFYDQDDPKGGAGKNTMKAAQPGPGGKQTIKRLEARGGVVVIQKEQTATGETGIFEMKNNTVTLVGGKNGVVINQGANLLRGDRLVVDLGTGHARVESDKGKTVQGIFSTSKDIGKDDKPAASAPGAQSPAAKKPQGAGSSKSPFPAPIGPSSVN